MDISMNWLAIVLAAVSAMIVGSIWYGPAFGKMWMKLTKVKMDSNFTAKKMAILYGATFITVLASAAVLAFVTELIHSLSSNAYLLDAVFAAIVLSVGVASSRIYMQDSFEGRRKKLTTLNISNVIVTYLIMAVVIGLIG